jgi:hypothetical protein
MNEGMSSHSLHKCIAWKTAERTAWHNRSPTRHIISPLQKLHCGYGKQGVSDCSSNGNSDHKPNLRNGLIALSRPRVENYTPDERQLNPSNAFPRLSYHREVCTVNVLYPRQTSLVCYSICSYKAGVLKAVVPFKSTHCLFGH